MSKWPSMHLQQIAVWSKLPSLRSPSLRFLQTVKANGHETKVDRAPYSLFATCHPGLEEVVAAELSSPQIAATDVSVGKAGVEFSGDVGTVYRANLWLRAAIRVLQLLTEIDCDPRRPAGDEIYDAFRAVNWASQLAPGRSFSVEARISSNSNLTNSQLVVVRARDAICDTIRDVRGSKPLPPLPGRCADLPLFATMFQDRLSIYKDTSGESLHRRGYRQAMHRASLNEAAAAGCLVIAGWPALCLPDAAIGSSHPPTLADPMCGSGTFLIEAGLMATNTAPGLFRKWWPFLGWPEADQGAWRLAKEAAEDARIPDPEVILWGNDIHEGALSLFSRDAAAAGVKHLMKVRHGGCADWKLPHAPDLVMVNPPWGHRLMPGQQQRARGISHQSDRMGRFTKQDTAFDFEDGLEGAWSELGTFLKQQATGSEAFVLSGNSQATQHLRLRASRRTPLTIGGVDCRLLSYSIHGPATETHDGQRKTTFENRT